MERITIPYSGELLLAHLAAYGLAVALEDAGTTAYVRHDDVSLSFEPIVEWEGADDGIGIAAAAIRRSAERCKAAVEADVEPGKTGNYRRAVIWARASFANDPSKAKSLLQQRGELLDSAEQTGAGLVERLLAGLGAPAVWGPDSMAPSRGATRLDGVLGNHTSDLVRGVLRPARSEAATATAELLAGLWKNGAVTSQLDKTGWAPPGTAVDLVHQWLAVLGLCLLPVAHRRFSPSDTPACWRREAPVVRGVTLPVLSRSTSVPRLRALIGLRALTELADAEPSSPRGSAAAATLRGFGVIEAVAFERLNKRGSGSSVAFSFRRARRLALS